MTESQAIVKANAVMAAFKPGADLAPTHPVEFKSVGGRRTWTFHYEGCIVTVNDKNGDVAVFPTHDPRHTF